MRRFVIGDIHGAYKALIECLKGVDFDYNIDKLVFLGDVCDGWSEFIECIEELSKIKNLVYIRGNHDQWTLDYIDNKMIFRMSSSGTSWLAHGGQITKDRLDQEFYKKDKIKSFIESGVDYHIDNTDNVFVHAGFNQNEPIESQSASVFMWDRNMVLDAINRSDVSKYSRSFYNSKNTYNKIYIGHTPTDYITEGDTKPRELAKNIVMMDTGAAFTGVLTIMNIDDGSIFQSTAPYLLYPNEKGRNN